MPGTASTSWSPDGGGSAPRRPGAPPGRRRAGPARILRHAALGAGVSIALAGLAGGATGSGPDAEPTPVFTEAFLEDEENIRLGRTVWNQRCGHCHGQTAYPGKAPRLSPRRYRERPQFVYDRVTNGFKGMPSWKHEFDQHERMAVVAYILSKKFR